VSWWTGVEFKEFCERFRAWSTGTNVVGEARGAAQVASARGRALQFETVPLRNGTGVVTQQSGTRASTVVEEFLRE
jgi:hypothetical protein